LIFSILLVGCHKLVATTQINPDGSGKFRTEVGFSAEERENLEKESNKPDDFCNTAETPPNITVTEEQREDETWCITTASFNDLDELRDLYQQREGLTINHLEIIGGTLYYDIEIDTLSEDSSFSTLSEITWTVILPDIAMNHNADRANGSMITWAPASKSGVINMSAQSRIPEDEVKSPICGTTSFMGVVALLIHLKQKKRI
jgi:hypothetical protein